MRYTSTCQRLVVNRPKGLFRLSTAKRRFRPAAPIKSLEVPYHNIIFQVKILWPEVAKKA